MGRRERELELAVVATHWTYAADYSLVGWEGDSYPGPHFYDYQVNDDSDGDGVLNDVDAFRLDATVALDRDRDGAPDAYTAGHGAGDSALVLDAYPDNAACQLPEQGDGQRCDIVAATNWSLLEQLSIDERGVVYLRDYYGKVQRWDSRAGEFLGPILLPPGRRPASMVYSAGHQRLYLGDSGTRVGIQRFHEELRGGFYAYDGPLARVFYLPSSEPRLRYTQLNPATGAIISSGGLAETEPESTASPLLRISVDGSRLLLGGCLGAYIYDAQSLDRLSSLERSFRDAQLLADGHVIGLTETDDGNTALEDFDASGDVVERVEYAGVPFGVLPFEDHFIVVIQKPTFGAEAVPVFETYVPSSQ